MPYYEYECQDCGEHFDVMLSYEEFEEHPQEKCPRCDSEEIQRVFTDVFAHTAKKS